MTVLFWNLAWVYHNLNKNYWHGASQASEAKEAPKGPPGSWRPPDRETKENIRKHGKSNTACVTNRISSGTKVLQSWDHVLLPRPGHGHPGLSEELHWAVRRHPVQSGLPAGWEPGRKGEGQEEAVQVAGGVQQVQERLRQELRVRPQRGQPEYATSHCIHPQSHLCPPAATIQDNPLQLVQIYFDTATYDEIELGVKTTVEAQLGLIGGTMGLLTGFSVLSGVEIVYYGVKFLMSIWHSRANLVRKGGRKLNG